MTWRVEGISKLTRYARRAKKPSKLKNKANPKRLVNFFIANLP
jgi:hypothetical protein